MDAGVLEMWQTVVSIDPTKPMNDRVIQGWGRMRRLSQN